MNFERRFITSDGGWAPWETQPHYASITAAVINQFELHGAHSVTLRYNDGSGVQYRILQADEPDGTMEASAQYVIHDFANVTTTHQAVGNVPDGF